MDLETNLAASGIFNSFFMYASDFAFLSFTFYFTFDVIFYNCICLSFVSFANNFIFFEFVSYQRVKSGLSVVGKFTPFTYARP